MSGLQDAANRGGTADYLDPSSHVMRGRFLLPSRRVDDCRKDKRMALKEELEGLRDETLAAISEAETSDALEEVRIGVLGKKGSLTSVLRSMRDVPARGASHRGQALQ